MRWHHVLGLAAGILLSTCTYAKSNALAQSIDNIIKNVDPNVNIGIEIADLNTNTILYQRNADRSFMPASNLKLYTAAAALLYLGPDYRFTTSLSTDAKQINNGVLKGNLYLNLSGDPSLTQHDLANLLSQLREYPITSVKGDIIINNGIFATQAHSPGFMIDDTQYGYGASPLPAMLDENELDIQINPSSKVDKKANLQLAPNLETIKLINNVSTVAPGEKKCKIKFSSDKKNTITADGCVYQTQPGYTQTIAIAHPDEYLKRALLTILREQNIDYTGKIIFAAKTPKTKTLAQHQSAVLSQLLFKMQKVSDNLYADAIFLKLGAVYFNKPSSWHLSADAIEKILTDRTEIEFSGTRMVDGSGASRYNLVSPAQLTQLLSNVYDNFSVSYEYIEALPVSGRDHTRVFKQAQTPLNGWIRAKTGSMAGVSALSGYLMTRKHHLLVFSIIINGFAGPINKYRRIERDISKYLIEKAPIAQSKGIAKLRTTTHLKAPTLDNNAQQSAYQEKLDKEAQALRHAFKNTHTDITRNVDSISVTLPISSAKQAQQTSLQKLLNELVKICKPFKNELYLVNTTNPNMAVIDNQQQKLAKLMRKAGITKANILQIINSDTLNSERVSIRIS